MFQNISPSLLRCRGSWIRIPKASLYQLLKSLYQLYHPTPLTMPRNTSSNLHLETTKTEAEADSKTLVLNVFWNHQPSCQQWRSLYVS